MNNFIINMDYFTFGKFLIIKAIMQKSRGFEGELIIEIPKVATASCEKTALIRSLFIARMGFFQKPCIIIISDQQEFHK
ncbi:hypothetical protein [Emticicia sp.]|uniref:hypothetical protein n=1 Tax=Emticicia sp. TaxID=1930953 RepID=UPI00375310CA